MPDLPKSKVGIVACSGEEIPEGTATREAALKVLEQLRPADTVTICLPLFLAGGEGDRAFARFYPTIAIDGCEKRCAARATELFSGKPASSLVVTDIIREHGLPEPRGLQQLDENGQVVVDTVAELIAEKVDGLLGKPWSRREGEALVIDESLQEDGETFEATCACGSGIPIQKLIIGGQETTLVALPLIFDQFHKAGKMTGDGIASELIETVAIYNPIPKEDRETYKRAVVAAYQAFLQEQEPAR